MERINRRRSRSRHYELAICFGVALLTLGCGSSSTPSGPSQGTAWTLSGNVIAIGGGGISGATVILLDGPSAGQSRVTDTNGHYAFTELAPGGFTAFARAS